MLKFYQIKSKIQNIGEFKSLKQIKKAGLRIVYNKKADAYWLIEQEFLKPVIKSPRECKSIVIKLRDLKYQIFMCHKSKQELKNCKALDYINWGERQEFNKRPSCRNRKYWWDLIEQKKAFCSYPMINNERLIFCKNEGVYNDANLVGIYPNKNYSFDLIYTLNSTYNMINMELLGIANLGEGAIKQNPVYIKKSIIVKPKQLIIKNKRYLNREIKSIFTELGFDPQKPIRKQEPKPLPDRAELDKIVFDALNLTEQERQEVYFAVAELVQNRLTKARSV